jgi:hypothetical protein
MAGRVIRPRVERVSATVRAPHPLGVALAAGLARLHGRGINGQTGTVRYGWPGIQTQRTKYAGYLTPAQLFIGYDPKHVAAGSIRNTSAALPATSAPEGTYSPLLNAMANVTNARQSGGR